MQESCLFLCLIKPILSLIMFVVTVVPSIICIVVPNFLLTVAYAPMDGFLVLKTLIKTSKIGPNLKVFGAILFFPCAALYPVIVLLGLIFYSICIAAYYSFDLDLGGLVEHYYNTFKECHKYLGTEVYEYCLRMTEPTLGSEVVVFDVSFHLLILCSFVSLITVIINFTVVLVIGVMACSIVFTLCVLWLFVFM